MAYGSANVPGKLTPADVGAVPTTRKVNGKALSGDISLSASDVGAAASGHTHTASDVGAADKGHKHTKSDITDFPTSMPASDVPSWAKNATKPSYTASEVGALPSTGGTVTGKTTFSGGLAVTSATKDNDMAFFLGMEPFKEGGDVVYMDRSKVCDSIGASHSDHVHSASDVGASPTGHTHTAAEVGAVPTTRKVNGKALSGDISLSASDVGASPTGHTHTAAEVGAVPTTRKVNGKALSGDISLSASDVGAAASSHKHTKSDITDFPTSMPASDVPSWAKNATKPSYTASEVGARPDTWTPTAADVGAVPAGQGGVGKSMYGQSVSPTDGTTVTAGLGAEIFNEYRERIYLSGGTPGSGNVASGSYSHAEGYITTASGSRSHAEGGHTTASGSDSHAEGYGTEASGQASHAEGYGTEASGQASHAEGIETTASGQASHAEGGYTTASEIAAHAEGWHTIASAHESHAEGNGAVASGQSSHAEGFYTTASGCASHAEGDGTTASGDYSHAGGVHTVAAYYAQTAIGKYNTKPSDLDSVKSTTGDFFAIGKGSDEDSRANIFRVTSSAIYGTGSYNSTGADYAELFEWVDGNPDNEDRRGLFVALDGEKIHLAGPGDDFILGIISGAPSVVGDVHDDQWQGMYLYDIYGSPLWEDVEVPAETVEEPDPEDPEKTTTHVTAPAHIEHRQKLNPNYDSSQPYIPRTERPEWGCVGMMGKLVVRDDGTCQVNGWAIVGEGGVATHSVERTDFRVMSRMDDTHVRVLILGRR